MDGAARQIGVARCGLEVAVTEQLTDHLQQGLAARQRAGREAVPNIVWRFENSGRWRGVTRHVASQYRSNPVTI